MQMRVLRKAQTTILAVGEGKAELLLLGHLKQAFGARGSGTSITVRGGFGKGGKGVLDYAIRIANGVDYDDVVLLLDCDTDWDDAQRRRARSKRFTVVESKPCLESWLLAIHGDRRPRNTAEAKAAFERRFKTPAHRMLFATHFPHAHLQKSRGAVDTLDQLLCALRL